MNTEQGRTSELPEMSTINVSSTAKTEVGRLLSNFADTPFELDGNTYTTVESFWQGLYFPEGSQEREQIAQMSGRDAKRAAVNKPINESLTYDGEEFAIGSQQHHELMKKAVRAKLEQNPDVLQKLLTTGDMKITHLVIRKDGTLEPDSTSIPREIFSQILMDLREEFRNLIDEQHS